MHKARQKYTSYFAYIAKLIKSDQCDQVSAIVYSFRKCFYRCMVKTATDQNGDSQNGDKERPDF